MLLVGETVEWETVEYVDDAVTEGRRKALVVIGHIPSEQAGMEECTRWLKGFVKGVPVEFVPAKQPFRRWPQDNSRRPHHAQSLWSGRVSCAFAIASKKIDEIRPSRKFVCSRGLRL